MVCRKFHYKWCRITCKHFCFLQDNTGADDRCDTKEVCRWCYPGCSTEDCSCNHGDKRKFCTTWDKGCCHDRHTTVSFIFNRTGSHDTRNATAGADQHWDKGLTGKTKFAEHSVHDEGNSCHVSASFQECQEDEQDQDLRNESENRTKTCYDTIQDQTSQPFCTADFVKYILNQNRNTWNPYAVVCRIRSCVIIFIHGCCCFLEICTGRSYFFVCHCLFIYYRIGCCICIRNGCCKLCQSCFCCCRIIIICF